MSHIRRPVFAGSFYPGEKRALEESIENLRSQEPVSLAGRSAVKGLILPHAGYVYSGAVAARTVALADLPGILVLLGPNHTGLGEPFSVMTQGLWQTPLGDVPVHEALAAKIVERSRYLKSDTQAHSQEHSLEVLLPFLQMDSPGCSIVPVVLSKASHEVYQDIARDIYESIQELELEKKVACIASSDMTHYEPQEQAVKKDRLAIDAIIHMDAEELFIRTEEHHITMCGVGPAVCMLEVVKALGAKTAELVHYQTSADASGDPSSVVGYAGVKIQ